MHAVENLQKWRKSNRELSEHPDYPIESWVRAVDGGQTNLDYWDWMLSQASESDHRAQEAAAKAAEERTDQLMVEGNLFYFVNGSTDYAEVIRTAPFFVAPVIKGYDYSSAPFPLQILTAANLCKAIEKSPRMAAGAILYGYGATSLEDANLILKRLRRYEQESADSRRAAAAQSEEKNNSNSPGNVGNVGGAKSSRSLVASFIPQRSWRSWRRSSSRFPGLRVEFGPRHRFQMPLVSRERMRQPPLGGGNVAAQSKRRSAIVRRNPTSPGHGCIPRQRQIRHI